MSLKSEPVEAPGQVAFDFTRPAAPKVYSVAEINHQVAKTLEARFSDVWIEGEIDSFKRHAASGHLYFNLKDGSATLSAMMPRLRAHRVKFPVKDGMKVRARGRVSLYEAQGRYQFYVDELELTGEGELLRAFEELKARLHKEGLFGRKRPLPRFPRCIGLCTSTSGAALKDILRVAFRRGRVRILLAPCQVQGEGAAAQVCRALERLQPFCDVIIVGRGGGSMADLWTFNDEELARAIFRSQVPVVSAVGHEVDWTIADLVADVRAPTPSAAAEIVVPDFAALEAEMADLRTRLEHAGRRLIDNTRQRLDLETGRAQQALTRYLARRRQLLSALDQRLSKQHPQARLTRDKAALEQLHLRLRTAEQALLSGRRQAFAGLLGKLDALSPLQVLVRGYAVVRDREGHVITDAGAVDPGDQLEVRLAKGELRVQVLEPEGG